MKSTKKVTSATAILKLLNARKSATAKEISAKLTDFQPKTIRNTLGDLVEAGDVSWQDFTRTCKVSGATVTAYTVA